jgi:antitoxin (DNA-binding transcriptional repressor) of toxin-antitoxin stability system
MMSKTVSKSKFKPKSLSYFREIEEKGEELIITDRGRPVLKVLPYSAGAETAAKLLRNSLKKYVDPTEPLGTEEWEAAK